MQQSPVQSIPFSPETAQMNASAMGPTSIQSLVTLKGVQIIATSPCCPPCDCMRARRYSMSPMTGEKIVGNQFALALDMTGCCDKKKHSSITTAPLFLEVSDNSKKKVYTGVIPARDKCCSCFCSCCPSLLPMTINNQDSIKISMMTREIPCCRAQSRIFFDASGTPHYVINPGFCCKCSCSCCVCGNGNCFDCGNCSCCICGNCRCCCCCQCCSGCEDVKTVPVIGYKSGDDGVIIRRIKYCPPCVLPIYEVIFPAGASQELRVAMVLAACELEYFNLI